MKTSLFILATLLSVAVASPAFAISEDHSSAYANADGGSKFSDPDDALGGDSGNSNPLGTVQVGGGSANFGAYGNNTGNYQGTTPPGYYGIYDPTRPR